MKWQLRTTFQCVWRPRFGKNICGWSPTTSQNDPMGRCSFQSYDWMNHIYTNVWDDIRDHPKSGKGLDATWCNRHCSQVPKALSSSPWGGGSSSPFAGLVEFQDIHDLNGGLWQLDLGPHNHRRDFANQFLEWNTNETMSEVQNSQRFSASQRFLHFV